MIRVLEGEAIGAIAATEFGTTTLFASYGEDLLGVSSVVREDQGGGEEEHVGEESAEVHVV